MVTAEIPVLLFILALFFAALLKKEKQKSQKILIAFISLVGAALTISILYNLSVENYIDYTSSALLMISENVIVFATIIVTHYYIIEKISEYVKLNIIFYLIPIINIIIVIAYSYFHGQKGLGFELNSLVSGESGIYGWAYLFLRFSSLIVDLIISICYFRKIGPRNSIMHISYEVFTVLAAVFDYAHNTSFIYVVIAFLLLIDYILVSSEQDLLIAKQKQRMAEQQNQLALEQTKITISQIQPHFLYNAISSIMACCKTNPDTAVKALGDFSDYLRQNMRSIQSNEPIPFSKELEHIKTYMRLEKLRFANRLKIEYDIEEENFLIPALSIQPLVENAVKHGVGQRPDGGTVTIRSRRVKNGVVILVIDDGIGFNTETSGINIKGDHIGLKNVVSRIEAISHGTLNIESFENKGTTVTVFIPENQEV